MDVTYEFNQNQIVESHQVSQKAWWTQGPSFEETKPCVESSQICVAPTDSMGNLQGFARVLTNYTIDNGSCYLIL